MRWLVVVSLIGGMAVWGQGRAQRATPPSAVSRLLQTLREETNPSQAVRDALDKAEDVVNERTDGKYAEQVDKGSDLVGEKLGLPPETEAGTAPEPAPSPGPAPVPTESPTPTSAPTPTPTEAGPAGADSGTTQGGGPVPDLPSEGETTLGDPPPAPPSS